MPNDSGNLPSSKTVAATIASAVGVIVVWALGEYAHMDIPEAVSLAGVTLLTFVVAYFVPENRPSPSGIAAALRLTAAQPHRPAAPPRTPRRPLP